MKNLFPDCYRVKGIPINEYGLSVDPGTAAIEKRLHRFVGPTVAG